VRSFLFDDGTIPQKFAAMRRRGFFNGEQLVIGPDGEERAVELIIRSFTRDDKQYYVALGHDVTPQKELQEATRQANLRLERLNRELRHVDQLRTGFLSTISQKLRSPLSAVLGYIEMLLQEELGDLTKDQRKALQTCRRGTLRAFRIIEETLAVRKEEEPSPPATDTQQASPDGPETPHSPNGARQD
jgi:signal transduction histidine kinase